MHDGFLVFRANLALWACGTLPTLAASPQGCAEIRWLAEKMGAKPATVSGLSGLGDIMLTCYGALSRNRAVGIRLGQGEALQDILDSSSQVLCVCPLA